MVLEEHDVVDEDAPGLASDKHLDVVNSILVELLVVWKHPLDDVFELSAARHTPNYVASGSRALCGVVPIDSFRPVKADSLESGVAALVDLAESVPHKLFGAEFGFVLVDFILPGIALPKKLVREIEREVSEF